MAYVRLIDANALKKALMKPFNWNNSPEEIQEQADFNYFEVMIDAAPTIDTVQVTHGRWVWFENRPVTDPDYPECIGCTGYECSECGNNEGTCIRFYEELSLDTLSCIKEGLKKSVTNYCSNCGAKMNVKEE